MPEQIGLITTLKSKYARTKFLIRLATEIEQQPATWSPVKCTCKCTSGVLINPSTEHHETPLDDGRSDPSTGHDGYPTALC